MRISRTNRDNLHFLTAEVLSQLGNLEDYFRTASRQFARRILDRGGYAHNLKTRIHESCRILMGNGRKNDPDNYSLRALESIASNLLRITELCRDNIEQIQPLKRKKIFRNKDFRRMLRRVRKGTGLIENSVQHSDTGKALKIGELQPEMDKIYRKLLRSHGKSHKCRHGSDSFIAVVLVAHNIQQMGNALLDISQTIISANLGQTLDIDRYRSLKASMEKLDQEEALASLQVRQIAETRSGSAISAISTHDQDDGEHLAIFKDGIKRKLREERAGLDSWQEIFPGLAPRVLSYHKRGQSAALLIEHLAGLTFEQILLHEPRPLLAETLEHLRHTLSSVWKETRRKQPVAAGYMRQLSRRLGEVYGIHPEFRDVKTRICGHDIAAFDTLLERADAFESRVRAPFSVYIHGDFNVDNIIYDPLEKKISFIDLHRSCYMDYVQDVSVFLVSMYRLQVMDALMRRRILDMALDFYRFAADYAHSARDTGFELRLALGLARSFATSTRFILDKSLARAMFLRARYLIERLLEADPQKPASFRLPIREIFIA